MILLATNFGFMPLLEGKRYFISYKSEDSERIRDIICRLNEKGVPMWYDYGIEKGERWSAEINANIKECEAVLLFVTKRLFSYEDTYVRKEFRLAKMHHKKIYVIWLDSLNPDENPEDVNDSLEDWYIDIEELQGIKMTGKSAEQIAWSAIHEFHLIQGLTPQPPAPAYADALRALRKQYAAKKRRRSISVIAAVAVVLVLAILIGIWAGSTPTSDVKSLSELDSVSVGDHFTFGNYKQGYFGGVQPIEWRVLDIQDGKALVISEKLLDHKPFDK